MKNIFFAEFFGTFTLVLVGTGIVANNIVGLVGAALTFGLLVAGMIFLLGEISGTQINPAVTFALALNGDMQWRKALLYWLAQFLGATAASALLFFAFDGAANGLGATLLAKGVSPLRGVGMEAIATFFLMLAVLFVEGKGYKGKDAILVITPTIILLVLLSAPLTGASLNPARSFGPALFTGTLSQFWIYLLGPCLGAALAVPVYRLMRK
jgi:aquaporin Z